MTAATIANVPPIQSVRLESGMTSPFLLLLPASSSNEAWHTRIPPGGERAGRPEGIGYDAQGWPLYAQFAQPRYF